MTLKTLKDIPIVIPQKKGEEGKELKELVKNLEYERMCASINFFREDLRAEAIKWVHACNGGPYPCLKFNRCPACSRFMEFFNLSEEDLK